MLEQRLSEIVDFVESKDVVYLDTCFLYGGSLFPNGAYALKDPESEAEGIVNANTTLDHTLDLLKRDNCFVTCKILSELNHHTYMLEKKYSGVAEDYRSFYDFLDRMNVMCSLAFEKTRMPKQSKPYSYVLKKIMAVGEDVKGSLLERGEDSYADEEIVATGLCVSLSGDLKVGLCSSDNHVKKMLEKGKESLNGNAKGSCELYLLI